VKRRSNRKSRIDEAFANAIVLPIVWKDEPSEVCEDRMFLPWGGDSEELESDSRDADVFWYCEEGTTEEQLRREFSKRNSPEDWYIPSKREEKAKN